MTSIAKKMTLHWMNYVRTWSITDDVLHPYPGPCRSEPKKKYTPNILPRTKGTITYLQKEKNKLSVITNVW
jgi:hypothetical protein